MSLKNIRLGHSPLTDTIYAGYLSKDGATWSSKTDVTNDFIGAVIARFAGFRETITSSDGRIYEITAKERSAETAGDACGDDIVRVMRSCLEDPAMIEHLVYETNRYMEYSGLKNTASKPVDEFQIRHVLLALADNTDFSLYS